jgi:acetylornithine deacetylase/succinyl-diaminopimelate desuccinylase-like protein
VGIVDEIAQLALIPAPTFDEEARLQWLERRLAGARGRRKRDRSGNLIWSWGGDHPELVIAAHVDTVFPLETKLTVHRSGTDLVGPGVGDNAAALAVAAAVTEELLRQGDLRAGAVAFTVGEEGLGNLRGAFGVCDDLAPAAFVALEGHGLEHVIVNAVGSVRVRLKIAGPGGHSWVDRGRPSAIAALVHCCASLLALDDGVSPVNVGTIAGGRSVNTIADHAECVVERRALGEGPLDSFTARVQELAVADGLELACEPLGRRPAGRLRADAPLLSRVRALRQSLGLPDRLDDGSTDANAAMARGIPALSIGVARGSGMHSLGERIDTASLDLGIAQLRALLLDLLGP